ncbi:MAG: Peptidase, M23/M37 family [Parcubacteria group bacterium GW2011_GWA2_42_35]|nr:MAG: Peptidase, M23/M37 family [Parcubacteria group bacterium GW2011_GWA2_42_35]
MSDVKVPIIKILLAILVLAFFTPVLASPLDDLKSQISERNKQIEELEKEIEQYRNLIDEKSKEAESLNTQISRLEATIKKISADIALTEKKIEVAGLNIQELGFGINLKENEISEKKLVLAEIIRTMDKEESQSMVEVFLAYENFSDFFNNLDRMENVQNNLNVKLRELVGLKQELQSQEEKERGFKSQLEVLENQMADKKTLSEISKGNKQVLLKETKKKESVYKNILADRLAKQRALEEEISRIEEKIRIEIDPASLPISRSGVLAWPLDKITITQDFGNTPFATKNPQIYNGKGHNGVDFRASVGESVLAADDGRVIDVGDTDKQCRGVSYGRWILIEHSNNLSTLYAHLSLIKVSAGETVKRGQLVGYSGDTGYVTGPHLHFTVFAARAVEVSSIKSKVCGTMLRLPLAPYNAYLNPLSYL